MTRVQYISKENTLILKGVSICFMLFYHLFFMKEYAMQCFSLFEINKVPLVYYLSRSTHPVSFFLVLGGYGMYIVSEKGDKHRYSRVLKLFIHYWIITLCFLGLGCLIMPNQYPGTWTDIFLNFTAYFPSYNAAMWFLIPYILISFFSKWIFRITKGKKTVTILSVSFLTFIVLSYVTSRYENLLNGSYYWLNIPIRTFRLLFAFLLGAMAAREGLFRKYSFFSNNKSIAWICLALIFFAKAGIRTSLFNDFYAFFFILLFLQTYRYSSIDKILEFLGKHSMNIWMIHNWVYFSLFTNFIYGFKYPLLCWCVLLLICVLISKIIDKICSMISPTL